MEFKRLLAGGMLALLLLAAGAVHARPDGPPPIRLGYVLNEASHQGRAARFFADEVARLSGGRMRVQPLGNAALGSDFEMQRALVQGRQEMMIVASATLSGVSKEMALWDTPFLFDSVREADAVLDGPVGRKVLSGLEEKGLVGLVYWENGFRNLTNSRRPVRRLEDFQGLRLRTMQNGIHLDSFRSLGTQVVPMAYPDLFGALESGAVDGQENPVNTVLSSRLYEVQKHLTLTNHVYSPWVLTVSKAWWDGLTPQERRILKAAARTSRDFARRDTRKEAARALAELKARGMQVDELPPAEAERIRARLTRVNAAIAASVGMGLWKELQAQLVRLREGS